MYICYFEFILAWIFIVDFCTIFFNFLLLARFRRRNVKAFYFDHLTEHLRTLNKAFGADYISISLFLFLAYNSLKFVLLLWKRDGSCFQFSRAPTVTTIMLRTNYSRNSNEPPPPVDGELWIAVVIKKFVHGNCVIRRCNNIILNIYFITSIRKRESERKKLWCIYLFIIIIAIILMSFVCVCL